jgi:hypothetical protein
VDLPFSESLPCYRGSAEYNNLLSYGNNTRIRNLKEQTIIVTPRLLNKEIPYTWGGKS